MLQAVLSQVPEVKAEKRLMLSQVEKGETSEETS
jgi:hypothetical protein